MYQLAAKSTRSDPSKTKTGKIRLGPLNLSQLNDLLVKSVKPKERSKIQNRIKILETMNK